MDSYYNIKEAPLMKVNQKAEEISFSSVLESIQIFLDNFVPGDFSFSKNHWHRTLQFNVVVMGTLQVSVNGQDCLLFPGEGIFINSNVIHCLNKSGIYACTSYSFQIPDTSICSDKEVLLYSKYVAPAVNNSNFSHLLLRNEVGWQQEILSLLHQALSISKSQEFACELLVKSLVQSAWTILLKNTELLSGSHSSAQRHFTGTHRIKAMLSYIHAHYADRLTLEGIAGAANISIAECNRCFHTFLNQTPFGYVTRFRTLTACQLLTSTALNISEIMEATGFREASYFYRSFRSHTGKTPRQYRQEFHS